MDINIHIERVISRLESQKYSVNLKIEELIMLSGDNNRMQIKAIINFFDNSFLSFYEIVETGKCFPQVIKYSYQYMLGDLEIFRYDNAKHHPDISTYPDHKHLIHNNRKQVVASSCPSHEELFKEIYKIIDNEMINKSQE